MLGQFLLSFFQDHLGQARPWGADAAGRGRLPSGAAIGWCHRQSCGLGARGAAPGVGVRTAGLELLPAFFALLILRGAELLVSQAPLSTQTPGRPRESCASGLTLRVTAGPGCSAEIGPSDGCERPGRTQRASTQGVQAGRSRRRMALGLAQDHRTRRWTLIPMRPLGFVWVE